MEKTVCKAEGWQGVPFILPDDSDSGNSGTNNGTGSRNNGGQWIDRIGEWGSTFGNQLTSWIMAWKGNYPTQQQDNTPKVFAIAGVTAIVLIVILLIIFKK